MKRIIKLESINLDAVGFSTSMLCAVHCAVLPFVLTLLPLVGLEFLANPIVEMSIIALGVVVGVSALWHGFQHHRNLTAVVMLVLGFGMIFLAHSGWVSETLEDTMTPIGASVVALAHVANWRLGKKACQSESCKH